MKMTTTEEGQFTYPDAFKANWKGLPPKVFELRQKLYRKAKSEPKFRFYALYDRVYRRDVLEAAWQRVSRNGGAPGVDGVSIKALQEREGAVEAVLDQLGQALREKSYQPQAILRVSIPKPDGGQRPLGIPTVVDRIAQMAVLLVIEPIFEADFEETSHGFRPRRSARNALEAIRDGLKSGRRQVVDADLKACFDLIDHQKLMASVEKRIADSSVLRLIRQWLKAEVVETDEDGNTHSRGRQKQGTPQGGVLSPLLANIYLHWLDRLFKAKSGPGSWANAQIVRYADDFVILTYRAADAQKAMQWLSELLEGRMGLTINRQKTTIRSVQPGASAWTSWVTPFVGSPGVGGGAKRPGSP